MAQPMFSGKQLPKYHEGMLIVKMRSSSRLRSALAATNERESVLESSGMFALSRFERAELIKQVIPLARPTQEESPIIGSRRAMATLATSIEGVSPENINAGVNIIELERDQDVSELQTALANEPNVEYVSRVPVRYLEDVLKVEASQKLRESPDHDPNHRYVDKSFGSFHKPFIIFAQAPTPVEPSKCSLNHPPFW